MKISKDLRLVLPVETEQGESYVHAQTVSREVFERYAPVILQAFTGIMKDSRDLAAGPKVAAIYIRDAADRLGRRADVDNGLLGEMIRLANVALLGANGWEMVPLEEVIKRGLIDADDRSEVENALAFFMLGFFMIKKVEREMVLTEILRIWGGSIISSDYTAFVASLPTSTVTATSPATTPVSSVPC